MSEENKSSENEEQLSPLYYFYSVGCGFCKKVDPIVDELIKDGHEILKLDVSDPDNQAINNELKTKFKAQCGTPWFINAETGHQVCGFREKDILEKWVKGEEIPVPPRPKSPPPPPPQDFDNKVQVAEWSTKYEVWSKENEHLPNLPPADQMLQRIRQQQEMMKQRQAQAGQAPGQAPGPSGPSGLTLDARISVIEQKVDRLLHHLGAKFDDIKAPIAAAPTLPAGPPRPPVPPTPPRQVPAPPASKKPAKKKRVRKNK